MRIIQITDLHIGMAGEDTFDVDVRGNFLRMCQEIKRLAPDYLVVTGDLCFEDPHEEIYVWIKQHLDSLEITYDLLSGNHDDPLMLSAVFERDHLLKGSQLYYQRQIEGDVYLFLDTTTGIIDQQQLNWLAKALNSQYNRLVIFMHHPPVWGGVPHMDNNYPLHNRDIVLETLLEYNNRIDVFCGHYHVDKTISVDNVNIHITPSSFFQIDQHQEDFAVDHQRPGLREIIVEEGRLSHTVIYF